MPPVNQPTETKVDKCNRTPQEMEEFRAASVLVRQCDVEIHQILNPPEFEEAAQKIFPENQAAKLLQEHFKILEFDCGTIYPDKDKCPPDLRHFAENVIGRPIHATQRWIVAIPNKHLESECHLALKVFQPFHGGGGTTGEALFDPFSYLDVVEYVYESPNAMIASCTYSLKPYGSDNDRLRDIKRAQEWMFDNLEPELQSINPNLTVKWDSFHLSGGSFGGDMALLAWLEITSYINKPQGFGIESVLCHAPTVAGYYRKVGEYLGTKISRERVERDRKSLNDALAKMPFIIPVYQATLPRNLFGGPVGSMGQSRKEGSTLDMIKRKSRNLESTTRFRITLGTEDTYVKLEDIMELVDALKEQGYYVEFDHQKGKWHAWDVNEPLDKDTKSFLDG
ncbi:hypothetical protein IQ07DRAFT_595744 [Pyrenochaeta sp. DS3sAY3a]|nr:hypothetical protein IQ07DRAFT_595744 [Pyrenochaeta sp. DS3sAY3a]